MWSRLRPAPVQFRICFGAVRNVLRCCRRISVLNYTPACGCCQDGPTAEKKGTVSRQRLIPGEFPYRSPLVSRSECRTSPVMGFALEIRRALFYMKGVCGILDTGCGKCYNKQYQIGIFGHRNEKCGVPSASLRGCASSSLVNGFAGANGKPCARASSRAARSCPYARRKDHPIRLERTERYLR